MFCFRCFAPPPSQGHIVLYALNQHMAVRIYGASSNQSAPFRASLRRARPIGAPERDPCLWVVLRCRHVTLGKGMPTWIRGKDATWVRYDNNTTKEGRKRQNRRRHRRRCFLHRPSFGLNTVGRGRYSGSPWSAHQRHGGSVEHFFDPAELETRGFLCRRCCSRTALPCLERCFRGKRGPGLLWFGFGAVFPRAHACGCVSEGHVYQPCWCGPGGLAATCADALTAATFHLHHPNPSSTFWFHSQHWEISNFYFKHTESKRV